MVYLDGTPGHVAYTVIETPKQHNSPYNNELTGPDGCGRYSA
jgi:hypothetical protein